ncbi:MAG: TolC family protein [Bacteroides sp.]|nr:TolC family protein [Bacteroides sp.]
MFERADSCSRSIRTYSLAEQEARQAIRVARNAQLPSIDVAVSASYIGDVWLSDRDFSHGERAAMPHFGNNFTIEASQVIYAGGAISSRIALAKLHHQLAQLDLENNKQDIRFLLAGNYLEMYKLKNQAEVYRRNIEQTRALLAEITAKQQHGITLKNDITRYELQLQSLQLALTQVENGIVILNHQLITVLGLPEETQIEVDSHLLEQLPLLSDENRWQETALFSSPLLQQARLNIEQSQYGEKLARSGRLPSVALMAGDNLEGPITFEIPPINRNINYWYVGVGVKFNLASTFKSGKEIRLARLSTQKARESDLLLQEHIRTEVKEAYIRFRESFTLYETQVKSLELAHQNYHVINNRYLNDLALLTDMLDASNSQLNAELQVVNAQIHILFHYYKLKRTTGTL